MKCRNCGKVFFNCCSISDVCKDCEKKLKQKGGEAKA